MWSINPTIRPKWATPACDVASNIQLTTAGLWSSFYHSNSKEAEVETDTWESLGAFNNRKGFPPLVGASTWHDLKCGEGVRIFFSCEILTLHQWPKITMDDQDGREASKWMGMISHLYKSMPMQTMVIGLA